MSTMNHYGTIYVITNKVNGKKYVGQTTMTLHLRWKAHKFSARKCQGQCIALERALQKYGADTFTVEPLANAGSKQELDALEKHWIDNLKSHVPLGYNIKEGGASGKHSIETRVKIAASLKGRPKTQQHKQLIGASQRGELNHRYGKKNTPEHRQKCSKALRGEQNPNFGRTMSEEQKQRLREAHLGRKQSPEWVAKVVAANLGAKRSDMAKARMAAAQQAWWAQDTERTRAARAKIRAAKREYWANWRAQRGL